MEVEPPDPICLIMSHIFIKEGFKILFTIALGTIMLLAKLLKYYASPKR